MVSLDDDSALQERAYLKQDADGFSFKLQGVVHNLKMPNIRARQYTGPALPRAIMPSIEYIHTDGTIYFRLEADPASKTVTLYGASVQGETFCLAAGGNRVEANGADRSCLGSLDQKKEKRVRGKVYKPATLDKHLHPFTTLAAPGAILDTPASSLGLPRNQKRLKQNFIDDQRYILKSIDKSNDNKFKLKIRSGSYDRWIGVSNPDFFVVQHTQQMGEFVEVLSLAQRLVIIYSLSSGNGASVDAYHAALQGILCGLTAELLRGAQRDRGPHLPCGDHGVLVVLLPKDWETRTHTSDRKNSRVYHFHLDQGMIATRRSLPCCVRVALDYMHSFFTAAAPFAAP